MKHLILTLTAAATLIGSVSAAELSIATIDLRKAFDSYWKTKQADAGIKERAAELDKTRKGMVDDFQKAQAELKQLTESAEDAAVAEAERAKRKDAAEKKIIELRELQQQVEQFDRQSRTTLAETQRRLRDNILVEIKEKIAGKAKARNYNFVFDTARESRNETLILMYTSGANDITEEIVAELNANAPEGSLTAPTPAPAAPKQ